MRIGDIICTKAITHRQVVELASGKRRRPRVNQFFFKFDEPHSLQSHVGVFIYVGTVPEGMVLDDYIDAQLKLLGYTQAADDASKPVLP